MIRVDELLRFLKDKIEIFKQREGERERRGGGGGAAREKNRQSDRQCCVLP